MWHTDKNGHFNPIRSIFKIIEEELQNSHDQKYLDDEKKYDKKEANIQVSHEYETMSDKYCKNDNSSGSKYSKTDENTISVDDLLSKYNGQTIPKVSQQNNHNDYTDHIDNGMDYDDYSDCSRDDHTDRGNDYDDFNDNSYSDHSDSDGFGHEDLHDDYTQFSHTDEEHDDSHEDYDDESHTDEAHEDYNQHTDY